MIQPGSIWRYTVPAVLAVFLAACSKSGDTTTAPAQPQANGLADIKNPAAIAKVAESALPKGDPATPLETYRQLDSGHQVMFLYYALANLPVPYDDIAQVYSSDYSRTTDSFKRNDIVKALKPRIDQEIAAAKNGRYVMLEQREGSLLQRYNFDKKSFAINEYASSDRYRYFNDNSQYTLAVTNSAQFANLPVGDESKARQIEGYLSKYTDLRLQTYAFVQDADPSQRRIKLQVLKVRLLDPSGSVLAEL